MTPEERSNKPMLSATEKEKLESELRELLRPGRYIDAESDYKSNRSATIIAQLIDDNVLQKILLTPIKEPLVSEEMLNMAIRLGYGSSDVPSLSIMQKWLRECHNHNIVPVRVANPYDNHDNHKIYLNGREWYLDGTYVVRAGYENCLVAGIIKSLIWLFKKHVEYENNAHEG